MLLQGKKLLLAVTGSIAAYKTPALVRLLIKSGAEVKVIMTRNAADFVSPLALSTVSKSPVLANVHDGGDWNNHVYLGRWADAMLIAPCSANTLAKLAAGLCDNLVCAVYLSATCPVFIAPAMDEDMWAHPSTRGNLARVRSYGNHVIPVAFGELASGLVGEGRMAEPEDLRDALGHFFSAGNAKPLDGKKALVTAGPTFERIDPVRFIGNFSTGKMGIAIAEALAAAGAMVTLVLGPTHLGTSAHGIKTVRVESGEEMFDAASNAFGDAGIAVFAAAVADYKPSLTAREKIKKTGDSLELRLVKTIDVLAMLAAKKRDDQIVVGFALETMDERENGLKKLHAKGADMIVLNSLRDAGAGFGHDTNKVTLLYRSGEEEALPLQSKAEVAVAIVAAVIKLHKNQMSSTENKTV